MPYELPSMGGLAEEIKKSSIVISDPNYSSLCTAVDNLGLEGAIDTVNLLPQTLHEIRSVVWKAVNVKDLLYFEQHPIDLLAPGGISHSGPGGNRQLWPDENSQS